MRILIFCHSILSDWNHGNAHFLRGVTSELIARGHDVRVYEPENAWSVENLIADQGAAALDAFHAAYPNIRAERYCPATVDLSALLARADLVIVHEWNDAELIRAIGGHHERHPGYRLFFHDSHHRCVTAPQQMERFDLRHYDGVLAFGRVVRDVYLENGWAKRAWTWHEAADTRVFHPVASKRSEGDLVWIGNWGDEERTAELSEFLLQPVKELGLKAKIYGVRYPVAALEALEDAGIEYGGYLPNFRAPEVFGRYRFTVHVPRRPYAEALPGIPTIRVFEALACAIPLFSAPWRDSESLFSNGEDYAVAADGRAMTGLLKEALARPERAQTRARCGFEAITARHTCAHRVDELLGIFRTLEAE
ncbi:MAG: glycosyltransferase [Acidobacteriota bacterium]|nr:glycosyltransferase [Acidobacteriota bacterium]